MSMQSCETNNVTKADDMAVRLSNREDLPRILAISNWAILHTAANFRTEPQTLEVWASLWDDTHRKYAWFVSEKGSEIIGFAVATPHKGR
ncbi:MAG: hypothetical protein JSU63_18745 [Phycisphaerales bacterium]|nr:MAG: hypothetical protein JSU63_18745 [Phycisphaerales bacterium]